MSEIKINNIVEGQITGITKYGIFVSLEDNYTGMVHISEVSNKYVNDLQSKFKIGDVIKVKIISKKVIYHLLLIVKINII